MRLTYAVGYIIFSLIISCSQNRDNQSNSGSAKFKAEQVRSELKDDPKPKNQEAMVNKIVQQRINTAAVNNSEHLDLSYLELKELPTELFKLSQVKELRACWEMKFCELSQLT